MDRALGAAAQDLDDVEELLGRPIQTELAAETGVDVALETLLDVGAAAAAISTKMTFLHGYASETRDLAREARERLSDLRSQVDMFRRQCQARDRPLCETVDPDGLDVTLKLDKNNGLDVTLKLDQLRNNNLLAQRHSQTGPGESLLKNNGMYVTLKLGQYAHKTPWRQLIIDPYRPSGHPLLAKILPTFVDIGCHMVSTYSPTIKLSFLDQ
ncbi:unnamed protein product [Timema podura]|uniref:Uncharacterized protein n=1 Tax=Timema podura TaxID=61482 RepID=A0ABN7NZQ1_TIMPD|nr:unnamed protein product [Timema podura]